MWIKKKRLSFTVSNNAGNLFVIEAKRRDAFCIGITKTLAHMASNESYASVLSNHLLAFIEQC